MRTVVARWNEDVSWAGPDAIIIQKDVDLPNYGREPSSFLHFIIENYDELEGDYAFRQGRPFDHWPLVQGELECTKNECRYHPGLPWELFNAESGVELPDTFTFHPGGQFDVSAEKIKQHPKEFYVNLYNLIIKDELIAWILERTWGVIFNI